MVADRDQLYLSASTALGVSREEADALVAELNRLYADEGWAFYAAAPQRWYLRLSQPLAMRTTPTPVAMGRRVGEVLPEGDDALAWQRVMTEIQMLLHASAVNAGRSENGQLTVNSLWFWGGGALPAERGEAPWCRIAADEPLVRGLARLHGIEVVSATSLPSALAANEGRMLVHAGAETLELAERELFAPLLERLRAGTLAELIIILPGVGRWRIERADLRRWWRRRKALPALLAEGG
jgi:hypothetical protein